MGTACSQGVSAAARGGGVLSEPDDADALVDDLIRRHAEKHPPKRLVCIPPERHEELLRLESENERLWQINKDKQGLMDEIARQAGELRTELAEARREIERLTEDNSTLARWNERNVDELAALRARLALAEKLAEAANDYRNWRTGPLSGVNEGAKLDAALRAFKESKP